MKIEFHKSSASNHDKTVGNDYRNEKQVERLSPPTDVTSGNRFSSVITWKVSRKPLLGENNFATFRLNIPKMSNEEEIYSLNKRLAGEILIEDVTDNG